MLYIKTLRSDNREDLIKEINLMFNKGYILFGSEHAVYDDEKDEYGNEIYDPEFKYYEQSVILFSGQKVIKSDNWDSDGFVEIHDLSSDNYLIKELHFLKYGNFEKSLFFKKENDDFILFKKITYWFESLHSPRSLCEGSFELQSYDDYYNGQGYNKTMSDNPDYPIKAEFLIDGIQTDYFINSEEQIDQIYTIKNGYLNGEHKSYYTDGTLRSKNYYKDGELHGLDTHYGIWKYKKYVDKYENGNRSEQIVYDHDGRIVKKILCRNLFKLKEIYYTLDGKELVGYYTNSKNPMSHSNKHRGCFVQPLKFSDNDIEYEHYYENYEVVKINEDKEY